MKKMTRRYRVWNFIFVILLSTIMSITILDLTYDDVDSICINIIIFSIIWILFVPMFTAKLAKEKNMNPKIWFKRSIITTLLAIFIAIICLMLPVQKSSSLGFFLLFMALLQVVFFFAFYLYRSFIGLDMLGTDSKEELVTYTNVQLDLSQIPDICPHCKNPNSLKLRDCEWCGNKIC